MSVLVKLPLLPSMLNQKLLSVSLENGRSIRKGDKSEKQKAKTLSNEQPCAPTPNSCAAPAISTVIARQVAGSRGSSLGLESEMPRLCSSAIMNSPKSPVPEGDVFMQSLRAVFGVEFSGSSQGMRSRKRLPKNLQQCRHR